MFRWDIFQKYLFSDIFLQAAWTTLWISIVAQLAGIILGLFLALMRISRFSPIAWIARFYIWLFRGSPLLVQVLLLWSGLPRLVPGLLLNNWTCVLLAFSLNEAAYMAEIIRAGIGSVDVGQMEAAKALGMRYPLAMRRIVLPQALRVIIPPLGNEFNNMLKTTSIASVISVMELTKVAQVFGSPSFSVFELLMAATVYYLILTTLWGYCQSWIENRLDLDRKHAASIAERKTWAARLFGVGSGRTNKEQVGVQVR